MARPIQPPPPQIRAQVPAQAQQVPPGGYKLAALPPGDYYAVALDTVDMQGVSDPDFLESLIQSATRFSLREGETKTLDFKISTRNQ